MIKVERRACNFVRCSRHWLWINAIPLAPRLKFRVFSPLTCWCWVSGRGEWKYFFLHQLHAPRKTIYQCCTFILSAFSCSSRGRGESERERNEHQYFSFFAIDSDRIFFHLLSASFLFPKNRFFVCWLQCLEEYYFYFNKKYFSLFISLELVSFFTRGRRNPSRFIFN